MESITADVGEALLRAANRWPDRPAVVDLQSSTGRIVRSYKEVADRAQRLAIGIRELGLAPGDRVAFLLANSITYVEAFFATALAEIGSRTDECSTFAGRT